MKDEDKNSLTKKQQHHTNHLGCRSTMNELEPERAREIQKSHLPMTDRRFLGPVRQALRSLKRICAGHLSHTRLAQVASSKDYGLYATGTLSGVGILSSAQQ